jgi:hypothetical protein
MVSEDDKGEMPVTPASNPTGWSRRWETRVAALSLQAELLILCARIGFNP